MQKLPQDDTDCIDRDALQDFQADDWTIYLASKLKCNSACHVQPAVTE